MSANNSNTELSSTKQGKLHHDEHMEVQTTNAKVEQENERKGNCEEVNDNKIDKEHYLPKEQQSKQKEEEEAEKEEKVERGAENNDENAEKLEELQEEEELEEEEQEDDEEEEEEEEEESETSEVSVSSTFDTDEAAECARADGLKEYNAGNYNAALDIQYKIVRYFEHKYGAKAAESGKYFLDYGLSQLRVLQLESSIDAVLQPRDVKQLEACYVNLSVAREGLQKKEQAISNKLYALRHSNAKKQKIEESLEKNDNNDNDKTQCNMELLENTFEEYVDVQLSIADVHNALAQLNVEIEDFDNALKEYEVELLLYRELEQEEQELHDKEGHKRARETTSNKPVAKKRELVPPQRIISTLYGIADCYMKEADYDNAEERLQATLDEIGKYPADTVAPELVEELKEFLDDAKEMKGGKYKEIQQTIQEQLAGDAERLPTAHEFYEIDKDDKHPFLSSLPDDHESVNEMNESSHLSMPMSVTGSMLGFNEHSNTNSQSISHFPHQSSSGGSSNHAFVGITANGNVANGHHVKEVNSNIISNSNNNINDSSDNATNRTVQVVQARKKPKVHPPDNLISLRSTTQTTTSTTSSEATEEKHLPLQAEANQANSQDAMTEQQIAE